MNMEEKKKEVPKVLAKFNDSDIEILYDWFMHPGFKIFISKVTKNWKNTDATADAIEAGNSINEYTLIKNSLIAAGRYDTFVKMKKFGDTVIRFFKDKGEGSSQNE